MNNYLNLFLLAITPGIAIFILFYHLDRYDKEPILLLLKLFIYGILIAVPVIMFEKVLLILDIFSPIMSAFYTAFVIAGFTEEFFKRFVVLSFAYKNKEYNEKFDGIVYAVVTALGFATIENILYVVFGFQSYSIAFSRALVSVPGHVLFAITMGYYLSLAKFCHNKKRCKYYFLMSLVAPIILHGCFDFIIFVQAFIIIPVFFIFLLFLYIINIKRLKQFYKQEKNNKSLY